MTNVNGVRAVCCTLFVAACLVLAAMPARAQNPPGPITISVDATDAPRRVLHAKLQFPVTPGPLTLYYPKWMPADHSPDGPIWNLAGLHFSAGGKEIPWQQDLVDMFAFNLEVPAGTNSLDASLDFLLSPPGPTVDFSESGAAKLCRGVRSLWRPRQSSGSDPIGRLRDVRAV